MGIDLTNRVTPSPQMTDVDEPRYPHVKCEETNCSVLLGATGSVLKHILNEQCGLNKKDDKVVVLPPVLFDGERSYADLEFLVYYNAYIAGNLSKDKPIQVVGTREQCRSMERFLSSTIDGPNWHDPEEYPFVPAADREFYKNIAHHFAPKNEAGEIRPLSDYVRFLPFDRAGRVTVDLDGDRSKMITIEKSDPLSADPKAFIIREYGQRDGKIVKLGDEKVLPVSYDHPHGNDIALPPDAASQINKNKHGFAVTCLGNSTGFDAKGLVTSFIVWTGGTGVLVDPSEDALHKIDGLGLSHHDLPLCLLSHCHQDHDGGLLKRMLQGKTINLMASRVVYEEFMSKADKLLEFQGKRGTTDPRLLVNWIEINPGDAVEIKTRTGETATFRNWKDIHPIPTNGFSVEFKGKTFGHSGDTQWSPELIDQLEKDGTLNADQAKHQRTLFFENGRPKFDLLHMEAGGGNIHTQGTVIHAAVEPEYHHTISLYHLPDSAVGPNLGDLKKIGLGETQRIIEQSPIDCFVSQKSLIAEHPHFFGLPPHELEYFINQLKPRTFEPGDEVLRQGDPINDASRVYFIAEGKAALTANGAEVLSGGCVGDWGIITDKPRSTTVYAKGPDPLVTLEMTKGDFDYLLSRKGDVNDIRRRVQFVSETHSDIDKFFINFTGRIPPECSKAIFALISASSSIQSFDPEDTIFKINDSPESGVFLVTDGYCEIVDSEGEVIGNIKPGSIAGEMGVLDDTRRSATVRPGLAGATGISIPAEAFQALVHYYPALRNGLTLVAAERRAQLLVA